MRIKNNLLFIIYTVLIGGTVGLIIWSFLKVMNMGIYYLWEYLPGTIRIPNFIYTIAVCLIGGVCVGLWKRKFGDFPEELEEVANTVKKSGRYGYNRIFSKFISALIPLLIGSSIGPESGLTGIIAGLCTWAGDKLKNFSKELKELTSIGICATLGTIFRSPLFGFAEPLENDEETIIPKRTKIILYFVAILSSFEMFVLLNKIFGGGEGFESLEKVSITGVNFFYLILLILVGISGGSIYFISKKITRLLFNNFQKNILIKCALGGLILGISGSVLPLTMFSGESQISIVVDDGVNIGIMVLLLSGIVKIFLTNICIESGLKGGHFFPMIFSGISIGYAFSLLLNIDSVFSMAVVTASLVSHILKKPFATVLLLLIVFPPNLIVYMLIGAVAGLIIKTPQVFLND